MRDIKKYKAPKAEVTRFECEDIITRSLDNSISGGSTKYDSATKYVKVGQSVSWDDIKNSYPCPLG